MIFDSFSVYNQHTYKWCAEEQRLILEYVLSNSNTMVCPPVHGDNPRALASGLSPVQVDNSWYNYSIPPTSV